MNIGGWLMISQAIVIQDDKVLMVKQYVQRGDIVWNFPGGGIENNETAEEACIREVKEETGFDVELKGLLFKSTNKFTFIAKVIGGDMFLDTNNEDNSDIVDVAWVPLSEQEKFDDYTKPLLKLIKELK
jgi:ADP-ribose pyrophosphatase YjhB (NUDIX family)